MPNHPDHDDEDWFSSRVLIHPGRDDRDGTNFRPHPASSSSWKREAPTEEKKWDYVIKTVGGRKEEILDLISKKRPLCVGDVKPEATAPRRLKGYEVLEKTKESIARCSGGWFRGATKWLRNESMKHLRRKEGNQY